MLLKIRDRYFGGKSQVGNKCVLRLDLKVSSEGFWRSERGRSFQVDGPETEKERRPTVFCLNLGVRKHKVSAAERRERDGVYR